jgi:hypothetical protein
MTLTSFAMEYPKLEIPHVGILCLVNERTNPKIDA